MFRLQKVVLGKKFHKVDIPEKWKVSTLSKLCSDKAEYGSGNAAIPFDSSLPRYIRITDIDDDGKLKKNAVSVELEDNEDKILKNNDFLFARTGSVGRTFLYSEDAGDCVFAGYLIRFVLDEKKMLPLFLKYYTHSNNYWRWVYSELTQGVQPNINAQQYSKLLIPVPTIKEQERIVSILTNIDDLINSCSDILQNITKLKQDFMQQLLTKGIGRNKFKKVVLGKKFHKVDIPEKWKVSTLSKLCSDKAEYGSGNAAIPFDSSLPRYIRITDIDDDGKLKKNAVSVELEDNEDKILKNNDFLFARTGSVGRTFLYSEDAGDCVFAGYLIRFVLDEKKMLPLFLKYYTHSNNYWRWVYSELTQGVQPNINAQQYSKLLIPVPTIKEQERIVSILFEIDLEIDNLESEKSNLEKLKKGFIEKLLTGQIKFKV